MWMRLQLKNWRSFAEADVTLSPFTVLVGPNASGKSNFVDAFMFAQDVSIDASTAVDRRGGIRSIRRSSPSKPYDVSVALASAKTRPGLVDDRYNHSLVIRSGKQGDWKFLREIIERDEKAARRTWEREGGRVRQGSRRFPIPDTTSAALFVRQLFPAKGGIRSRWSRMRRLRPDPALMRRPHEPTESGTLDDDARNIASAFKRLKPTVREDIISSMKQIVPGLRSISTGSSGRFLHLVFRQAHSSSDVYDFDAGEMSDGSLRAMGILVASKQILRNELLIIEEPEVNLHPGATQIVFDELRTASKSGAVLITTHSPELLDAADEDSILVCRFSDGVSRVGPLAESQRAVVREGLFSVAELMRAEPLRIEGDEPDVVGKDLGG